VRDRFGKKPLYVAALPKGLYFASEMQCLQAAGVPLEPDQEALRLYFQFLYVPDPLTAFRAVRKLPPGSYLMYEPDTGRVEEGRYWRLPVPVEKAPTPVNEETLCAELRRKFDEAVKIRMIADVPLGAFLSGGMDSSSVVASMALQSAEPVKTFSIGFEEQGFNELPYARMVAQKYRTEHHELVMRPDAVSLVEKLVQHFGEPFGDSSAIPTYLVSEFAGQHVKVVLTGDGGDELFGGYESFFAIETNRRWDRVPGVARRGIGFLADWLPYSAWGKNYLRMVSRPDALTRYFENNYSPYFMRQRLLTPEWMLPGDAAFLTETFRDCLAPNGADVMTQALYFEATAKLTGDMLVKVDRMSMANSIEVRCPMLDHELAELAQDIPHDWKVREGRGKYILIRALGSRLPAGLLDRPKMGFGVPLGEWFRGPLREMLWSHLAGRAFLERGIVSPRFVKTLLEEHQSGRRDNGLWLWALLMLELWFRNLQTTR
jgi:asparagine synthase (glutamine-hydrolysing)